MEKEAWSVYEGGAAGFLLEGPSVGAHEVWDNREEVYAASAALEMLAALKASNDSIATLADCWHCQGRVDFAKLMGDNLKAIDKAERESEKDGWRQHRKARVHHDLFRRSGGGDSGRDQKEVQRRESRDECWKGFH